MDKKYEGQKRFIYVRSPVTCVMCGDVGGAWEGASSSGRVFAKSDSESRKWEQT